MTTTCTCTIRPSRILLKDPARFQPRLYSLEKPADLAVWVLRGNAGDWNTDRVRAAMNGSPNQQINLAHPIPILIVYGTAIVTEDGIVHFYDDIYGHDATLEKVLNKGYPYPG